MRTSSRERWRLGLRDLASGSAFTSIAASGSVPAWAIAAFAVGLTLSLLGKRVLAHRSGVAAGLLFLAAIALFGSSWRGGLDLVVAACAFAALVTTHRLLSLPTAATDNQVHLTSMLMLTGGAALSSEVAFGPCVISFTFLACLSLGLAVLNSNPDAESDPPVRPLVARIATGTAFAVVGGIAFFVLFPRISWNVAPRRVSPGLGPAATGFAERVRLGGEGTLKTNPRLVLRATITPDPGLAELGGYWIGRTFDTFTGREWLARGQPKRPAAQVTLGESGAHLVHQQVELLPAYGAQTLVALERPVMVGNAVGHSLQRSGRVNLIQIEGNGSEEVRFAESALSYSYHAYSLAIGSARNEPPPLDVSPYLALPPKLDARVTELARQVVGAKGVDPALEPLAAAQSLGAYLQSRYRYTLELPGEVEDPLADFLFVRKAGHCEHFATALAVLLRTLGVPARVAAGFFGGERVRGQYVLRAGDAHAWTQVFVPGQGFVSLDATPEANRSGQATPWLEWVTRVYEELDAFWRTRVLDFSLQDQREMTRALIRPPRASGQVAGTVRAPSARLWLAAAVVALGFYAVWRSRHSGRHQRKHPATEFAERIDRLLRSPSVERSIHRSDDETLEALSARLAVAKHPLAPVLSAATSRYLQARFGHRPLSDDECRWHLTRLGAQIRRGAKFS